MNFYDEVMKLSQIMRREEEPGGMTVCTGRKAFVR
jgi:hypothetical protein